MNYEYNDKPIVIDADGQKYLLNPLSRNAIDYLESIGGTVSAKHDHNKNYGGFRYRVIFPNTEFGLSIIKNYGSYGYKGDLFEIGVLYGGDLIYSTDITHDVLGFMEEDDVLTIARLVLRLDENGRIKPLSETSQNEQLS